MTFRYAAALLAVFATPLSLPGAHAETFPSRPIRMIIPFAAGGGIDTVMRQVSRKAEQMSGITVVIENKPGAGGTIAALAAKSAPADGYTILEADIGTFITNASLSPNPQFDPVKDFQGIANIYTSRSALYVPDSSPAKSIAELLALGRTKQDGLSYASQGKGAIGHLLGSMFAKATGQPMVHVPYRGSSQATLDLITGRVDMMFNNYSAFKSEYEAGRLRALGVISPTRMAIFPGVPTMTEAGYPAVNFESWFGLVAPAGVPKDVVQKLNEIYVAAASQPDFIKWLEGIGLSVRTSSPAEFSDFIKQEQVRMKQFTAETGMTAGD